MRRTVSILGILSVATIMGCGEGYEEEGLRESTGGATPECMAGETDMAVGIVGKYIHTTRTIYARSSPDAGSPVVAILPAHTTLCAQADQGGQLDEQSGSYLTYLEATPGNGTTGYVKKADVRSGKSSTTPAAVAQPGADFLYNKYVNTRLWAWSGSKASEVGSAPCARVRTLFTLEAPRLPSESFDYNGRPANTKLQALASLMSWDLNLGKRAALENCINDNWLSPPVENTACAKLLLVAGVRASGWAFLTDQVGKLQGDLDTHLVNNTSKCTSWYVVLNDVNPYPATSQRTVAVVCSDYVNSNPDQSACLDYAAATVGWWVAGVQFYANLLGDCGRYRIFANNTNSYPITAQGIAVGAGTRDVQVIEGRSTVKDLWSKFPMTSQQNGETKTINVTYHLSFTCMNK